MMKKKLYIEGTLGRLYSCRRHRLIMKLKVFDQGDIHLVHPSCRTDTNSNRLHLACLEVPCMDRNADHHEARIKPSSDELAKLFLLRIRKLAPYSYSNSSS